MKRHLTYFCCCISALLNLFSCAPGEKEGLSTQNGGVISIRLSTKDLQVTKADTPGDGIGGDGGGFADYCMSFTATKSGTLSVWASSTDGTVHSDYNVSVLAGGEVTSLQGGYDTSTQVTFADLPEGTITIYPSVGALKFYKIQFTTSGDTTIWDFSDSDFQALLSPVDPLHPHPSLGASGPWNVTLNRLTIWSKGNSTWNAGGWFEWGGAYTAPDIVILIADNNPSSQTYGQIVLNYPGTGTIKEKTATEAVISFDFSSKPAGDYTVYAFGNTDGLWPMTYDPSDGSISLSGSQLTTLTTAAQVEALRFVAQTRNTQGWEEAGHENDFDDGVKLNNHLPVSAKAPLTVSSGKNGDAYLELLRCVAKVTAIIQNNTGEAMDLYNYKHTVHNINPNTGYVIPHDDDFVGEPGNLLANPCAKYGQPDMTIPISVEGSKAYDWYVFPAEGPFSICITFTLFKNNNGGTEKTYTYTGLPVTNWKAENIPALGRNQHLTVTTRISKGLTVSFNFQVARWEDKTATVEFD
jgi:hypothetical protein